MMVNSELIKSLIEQSSHLDRELTNPLIMEMLEYIKTFYETNKESIDNYNPNSIRFCDYYSKKHKLEEIITYFNDNYPYPNLDDELNEFVIYCIFKNFEEFLIMLEIYDNEEEIIKDPIFEELIFMIEQHKALNKNDVDFSFLTDNKYKIYFSGLSITDIPELEKFVTKALLKKIKNQMSTMDRLPRSESVEHVKEKYGVPIMRIQLADDYRVAYLRKGKTTAILGVELKSGKEMDYRRYDCLFQNDGDKELYKKMDAIEKDELSKDDPHYAVVDYISKFIKKNGMPF